MKFELRKSKTGGDAPSAGARSAGKTNDPRAAYREDNRQKSSKVAEVSPDVNEGAAIRCVNKQSGNGSSDPSKRTASSFGIAAPSQLKK